MAIDHEFGKLVAQFGLKRAQEIQGEQIAARKEAERAQRLERAKQARADVRKARGATAEYGPPRRQVSEDCATRLFRAVRQKGITLVAAEIGVRRETIMKALAAQDIILAHARALEAANLLAEG